MDRKSRMFTSDDGAVRRTIVGGRPPGGPGDDAGVPRGIEVLLRKAKVDDGFRALLLAEPEAAAKSIDLELSVSERAILTAVPPAALSDMVDRIVVAAEHRKVFRGRTAAAMLSLLAASFSVGCVDPLPAPGGIVVRDDPVRSEEVKGEDEERPEETPPESEPEDPAPGDPR